MIPDEIRWDGIGREMRNLAMAMKLIRRENRPLGVDAVVAATSIPRNEVICALNAGIVLGWITREKGQVYAIRHNGHRAFVFRELNGLSSSRLRVGTEANPCR